MNTGASDCQRQDTCRTKISGSQVRTARARRTCVECVQNPPSRRRMAPPAPRQTSPRKTKTFRGSAPRNVGGPCPWRKQTMICSTSVELCPGNQEDFRDDPGLDDLLRHTLQNPVQEEDLKDFHDDAPPPLPPLSLL